MTCAALPLCVKINIANYRLQYTTDNLPVGVVVVVVDVVVCVVLNIVTDLGWPERIDYNHESLTCSMNEGITVLTSLTLSPWYENKYIFIDIAYSVYEYSV